MTEHIPTIDDIRGVIEWRSKRAKDNLDVEAFDRWLAARDAAVAIATAAIITDKVRAHCTPSQETYARGGDVLIYAVADWIDNPPEWVHASWVNDCETCLPITILDGKPMYCSVCGKPIKQAASDAGRES